MQQEIVTHIQDAVRPGEAVDVYYSNVENSDKQAHATTVENRYSLNLQSNNSGASNTLIFNPDEGLDHIVLTLQLPAPSLAVPYAGLALNKGWGYALIKRIGVRYGGSTLYYFSSDQMLIDVMSDCEDSGKRDLVFQLGGQQLSGGSTGNPDGGAGDFGNAAARTAYVYIKLPHNSPSAQELPLPLPTDLLTSPVQVNIEFNRFEDVFQSSATVAAPGAVSAKPTTLAVARAQFKQIHFDDRSEQLARRHNMSEMAYSYPLKYFSQEVFRLSNVQPGDQSLTLTGLRSGNCQGIRIWVRADQDPNPFNYITPAAVRLSVNGLVYFDASTGEQQMWSLLDRKTAAAWAADVLDGTGATWAADAVSPSWTWVPFGQHAETLANENELVHGLSIMNSIVNLQLSLPPLPAGSQNWVVTAEYVFNSCLLFSRGSCDYVF